MAGAEPSPSPPLPVRVRGLTRRFGEFIAVDNVSFEVHPGQIFGFLGPNGAGKTTTIKMLAGLLAPTSGEGWVAGFDIRKERAGITQSIGYMSQRFSLYADLTARENIELFAGLYGVTGERFTARQSWILSVAGIEGAADRPTGELPLGWKQRLALGCAMIHEPPILFLDEPTSGVDPVARRHFWDLISEMAEGGTTVFVSTHHMDEAEYCHVLALMNRGRLIALDTPRELRLRVEDPILQVDVNDAPGALKALDGVAGIVEASMFGRSLHVTVLQEEAGTTAIRSALSAAGHPVSRLDRINPSLEDVFVALVRAEGGALEA
ncbi:MAG: ABC transporter ATP-binding protein [Gemmatimonadetes bacterium]|nr:ABC transporter ATP-binding protein [Gemmatimonadota bacterium]